MRLSKARQKAYRLELDGLAEDARSFVGSLIAAEMEAYPDASVAEMREMAKQAISDALFAFGDQAASLAGELFDEIASAEGISAKWVNEDTIDPAKMDSKVRYFADVLKGGATDADKEQFRKDCTALTRDYVKRNAFENMIRNCERGKVRWARVPSGAETCAFCFMLASRGFVYLSELTAKGRSLHGMHNHCDCIVVPGINGKTVIDGYDPDALYDRWSKCARTVNEDPDTWSDAKRRRIMREVETRDWKWLYSGSVDYGCSITKEPGAKPLKKEWKVAEGLSVNGFEARFIRETKKGKTPDAFLNGEVWEFKVPEAYNEKTVKNQFKKAIGKGTGKLVISNEINHAPMDSMIADVERILATEEFGEIREVIFLDRFGEMVRLKR